MSIELRKVSELKAHPLQIQFFGEPPVAYLQKLASSCAGSSLESLVEVLPDGTVIFGYDDFRAAQTAGLKEMEVKVNDSLEESDERTPARVVTKLAEDNLRRSYLDPFCRIRTYKEVVEKALGKPYGNWGTYHWDQFKQAIRKWMGLKTRTMERYFRAFVCPPEVQDAFAAKAMTLNQIQQIASLSAIQQQEIASLLAGKQSVGEVMEQFFPKVPRKHRFVGDALASFCRSMNVDLNDLEGRMDAIRGLSPEGMATLERGQAVIGQLLLRARRRMKTPVDTGRCFLGKSRDPIQV